MSYPRHSFVESYAFAEMLSVYCAAPADLAISYWQNTPYSPKLLNYWSLTIRLFQVICWTIIGKSYPSTEMLSVYSAAPVDWVNKLQNSQPQIENQDNTENKTEIDKIKQNKIWELPKLSNIDIKNRTPKKMKNNKNTVMRIKGENYYVEDIQQNFTPNVRFLKEIMFVTATVISPGSIIHWQSSLKQSKWKLRIKNKETGKYRRKIYPFDEINMGVNVNTRKARKMKGKYEIADVRRYYCWRSYDYT